MSAYDPYRCLYFLAIYTLAWIKSVHNGSWRGLLMHFWSERKALRTNKIHSSD